MYELTNTTTIGHFDAIFKTYHNFPIISLGHIEVRKHFLGGLYWERLIFGGHFVLVSEYQDLKSYRYISLL